MTLPLPQLDNRTFDQLMEEARKAIPRYAPEWTDHNTHDPGITFIELFAWLTEIQGYYLDRIRDDNYLKFLKLLGVCLKDANSATTDVTFSLVEQQMLTPVVVPQGSKLATKERVVFETNTSILLVTAHLEKIISSSGSGRKDNLDAQQQKGLSFYAFGEEAEVGSSLYLGFKPIYLFDWNKVPSCEENADTERLKQYLDQYLGFGWIKNIDNRAISKINDGLTIVITDGEQELTLDLDDANKQVKVISTPAMSHDIYFYILEEDDNKSIYAQPLPAHKTIPLTFNLFENYLVAPGSHREEPVEFIPSVALKWSYYSTAGYWQQLQIESDETQMLYKSGRVWFNTPIDMKVRNIFPFPEQEYWLRVTVDRPGYELSPKIDSILLNTISANQIDTLIEVLTFSSNGMCRQSLPTSYLALKDNNILQVKMSYDDWKAKLGRELSTTERQELVAIEYWQDWQNYEIDKTANQESIAITFREEIPPPGNNNVRVISLAENLHSLFRSNGLPYQTFSLKQLPIFTKTFQLQVKEKIDNNYYWRDWIRVKDFDASQPEDTHYSLDPQQGKICFGDGINGKIPSVPDDESEDNIRVICCQLVKGEEGNVEANTINEFYNPVSGLLDREFVTVANLKSSLGGAAHESIEQAKRRARKELKQIDRAVTNEDFEQLTLATPGLRVARAKAFLPQEEEPSSLIRVVVVPYSETPKPTQPSPGFLRAVHSHLTKHRLITTQVEVIPSQFVEVIVKAVVLIMSGFDPNRTRNKIEKFLTEQFLHPLTGGKEGQGWDFGRTVYRSEVYQAIENSTEGVDCVENLELLVVDAEKDIRVDRSGNIPIFPHSLIYSMSHQIEIVQGRDD